MNIYSANTNFNLDIPQSASCSSLDVPPPSSAIASCESDTLLVKGWLADKNKLEFDDGFNKTREMTLFQFADYVGEVETLLKDLRNLEGLQEITTAAQFSDILDLEVRRKKDQVDQLLQLLGSDKTQNEIKSKLKQRQKKRSRIKRLKQQKLQLKQEERLKRETKHLEIDSHLSEIAESVRMEKLLLEVSKEADVVLGEVRRKVHEGKRMMEMLQSLKELRKLRLEQALEKGKLIPDDSTMLFQKNTDPMLTLLQSQLGHYAEEERVLRTIMKIDRDHNKEAAEEPVSSITDYRQRICYEEKDVQAIIQTRHAWDLYIVPSGGSTVPLSWLTPPPPSSQDWNNYYVKTPTSKH